MGNEINFKQCMEKNKYSIFCGQLVISKYCKFVHSNHHVKVGENGKALNSVLWSESIFYNAYIYNDIELGTNFCLYNVLISATSILWHYGRSKVLYKFTELTKV